MSLRHFINFRGPSYIMKKLGPSILAVLLLYFHSAPSYAQQDVPPFYVDFHIHTILKNYYRNIQRPEQAYTVPPGDTSNWMIYRGDKIDTVGFNNVKSV